MRDFGNRLRWLREAMEELEPGLHSQQQWGDLYKVDAATISRWENGFFGTNFEALVSIVFGAGVDMNYLFFGVVPDWTPESLRDLLFLRHQELSNMAAYSAALRTKYQVETLIAVRSRRPKRPSRRRARKPKPKPEPSS
jgi:hypothetical protein